MSVLSKLASSLGRRDEVPNQELATQLVSSKNKKAIVELVENLQNKNKAIQSDCLKTLYEIGERDAQLIAKYDGEFLELLNSKNNRLVWGAMTALDCIVSVNPDSIYKRLPKIMDVMDRGSVITVDHGVNILIQLAAIKKYNDTCLVLLIDRMKTCATNQLPKYAEDAFSVINGKYKKEFSKVLSGRVSEIEKESKQKRIEKVLKKLRD